jgi:hypothetical protein
MSPSIPLVFQSTDTVAKRMHLRVEFTALGDGPTRSELRMHRIDGVAAKLRLKNVFDEIWKAILSGWNARNTETAAHQDL